MNDKAKQASVINGIRMEEGKVYLRDKRNGTVYQYESTLARMGFIEQFVFGEEPAIAEMGAVAVPAAMDGAARAAAWDAQARKNLRANEVTEVAEGSAPQEPASQEPASQEGKKQYMPTEKAKGFDLKADFLDKGWTKEQLLAEGYIVEVV